MAIFDYDRRRAYEYALRWAYRRNPLFTDFSELGGDDPTAMLDRAEARLNAIAKLKRKYGSTVEEIIAFFT